MDANKCARCENAEIETEATEIVSGEPWCLECTELFSCECERCGDAFESDDLHHGVDTEYCCYTCAQKQGSK